MRVRDIPVSQNPRKRHPRRMAFIPSDYRSPVVLGWLGERGWVPDEPREGDWEGFLVALKVNEDTPTIPPAACGFPDEEDESTAA